MWEDQNLRIDFGWNSEESKEIHFNLQKNKGAKLVGLKKVETDAKILSAKVFKGVAVDPTELMNGIVDRF